MANVVLCYIAKKVGEAEEAHTDNLKRYKDASWLPLEPFQESFNAILDLLALQWTSTFSAEPVEEPECTYLAVCGRGYALKLRDHRVRQKPVMNTLRRLLPMIMKEYREDLCLGTDLLDGLGDIEMRTKRYVTTPLFDLLYNSHLVQRERFEKTELALAERLQPTLYRYQQSTVHWLLKREREVERIPSFYKKIEALDGKHWAYKHRFSAHIHMEFPPEDIILPSGGILADEMGLGKTVEMLALILLNARTHVNPMIEVDDDEIPQKRAKSISDFLCICGVRDKGKQHTAAQVQCTKCEMWQHKACVAQHNAKHSKEINEPYICPDCWYRLLQQQPLETAATFIVTPALIKKQWVSEIQRHINPALRLLVYEGATSGRWISPRQLADYDLVITDYNVLRTEFYHTRDYQSARQLRNAPRAMRVQTPLLMVQWWRVCLDEAQMVESNTANAAKLVGKLPAVHRWAVTGTPITRSIDDLQPLIRFIGFEAACEPPVVWDNLVQDFLLYHKERQTPFIEEILQRVMWRTCKSKVTDELVIPPQSEIIHRLDLYNLEQLFYSDRHVKCEESFLDVLEKILNHKEQLRSITPNILKRILQPLLKIRQCCNMPLMSNPRQNALTVNNRFLGPEELHAHLVTDTEQEVKAELRSMASCFNGIAAIHFIKNNHKEALKYYFNVIKLAKDTKDDNITVDSLLQIHALHNVVLVHAAMPAEARYLSDDTIQSYVDERNELEWKYLKTSAAMLASVHLKYQESQSDCSCGQSEFPKVLTHATLIIQKDADLHTEFMRKIHDELRLRYWLAPHFQSVHGVSMKLKHWLAEIEQMRKTVKQAFEGLAFFMDNIRPKNLIDTDVRNRVEKFIGEVYDCHLKKLRQSDREKAKAEEEKMPCKLCEIMEQLKKYEGLFFDNTQTEGVETPSTQMYLLRVMISFVKSRPAFRSFKFNPILEKHLEDMECQQGAVKKLMKLWIEIEYVVKAYDELDMCKMRVSVTNNPSERNNFRILEAETGTFLQSQQYKYHEAQRQYATKRGRLKYIKHLAAGADPGACPICQCDNPLRYAVLECGHHVCYECLQAMRHLSRANQLKCSVCRNEQSAHTVYYAVANVNKEDGDAVVVKGKYSSKITFIVRLILTLLKEHSKEDGPLKIIIFSQWQPILNYISKALDENSIAYRNKITPETIEQFKNPRLNVTCLLMPLAKGSKGLNLIEATHVFLVEPILNPGEELQAIGRVHRFGQTKPTTVHRFIVNNTIEENIFNVVNQGKKTKDNWEFNNMSVENLRPLFALRNNLTDQNSIA